MSSSPVKPGDECIQRLMNMSDRELKRIFEMIPIDKRLMLALDTIQEYQNLRSKFDNLFNAFALNSPRVREVMENAKKNRKPIDRLADMFMDMMETMLKSKAMSLTDEDRAKLKEKLKQVMESEE
jgi:biopolymer transport protein ExbB/TolQ